MHIMNIYFFVFMNVNKNMKFFYIFNIIILYMCKYMGIKKLYLTFIHVYK